MKDRWQIHLIATPQRNSIYLFPDNYFYVSCNATISGAFETYSVIKRSHTINLTAEY